MTENFRKCRQWFAELHFWYKVVVVFLIAGIVFVWLYFKYGPVRRLEAENESLRGEIVDLRASNESLRGEIVEFRSSIESLRGKIVELGLSNAEPYQENLHCEELLDPIRRKAEQLYPALETDAAVAKLAEDLKTVREPPTGDMYRPLSPDVRERTISELAKIPREYRGASPRVKITLDAGSLTRLKVAEDLYGILKETGYTLDGELTISLNQHSPGVLILFNPEDSGVAYRIGTGMYGFIDNPFSSLEQVERPRTTFEIIIAGDPLFSEDGIVTFR